MKVTLITHTPEPEKVIASAAKLCYSSSDIESLMNGLTTDKIESFIEQPVRSLHSQLTATRQVCRLKISDSLKIRDAPLKH